MRGSVPRAKKRSVHVRSHISNRPNFVPPCCFKNFLSHALSLTGPPAIELALDTFSGSRCSLVYYKYYLHTAPLPSNNFPISQYTETELKRTVTGNSFRHTAGKATGKGIKGSSRHIRNVADMRKNPENLQGMEVWAKKKSLN